MKYKDILKIVKDNKIDHKMVNETLVIYPNDYCIEKCNYINLGNAIEDEDEYYDEFDFSDNFEVIPENIVEWLINFANTGVALNYERDYA